MGSGEAPWALIPPGSYVDVSADEIEKAAHEALEREIEEANAATGVTVERVVDEGPAADVILDASKDAELVVVGTRGHGALASLVLGSTSQQVIHRAHGPVAVIPEPSA
jgi:nucleotide-binding universal stress UspA family protein